MKSKIEPAFSHLLGLPERLAFVLFGSLLGSLLNDASPLSTMALSFVCNLAIYCFAQIYKHISNAPEDVFSPSEADPNPISQGKVSLRAARIALFVAALTALVIAFLSGGINLVFTFGAILMTIALFHPNIRLSAHPLLGFNQHHFVYAGIFLLNGIFAQHARPPAVDILFPLLFVAGVYLLFRSEEVRSELSQSHANSFWRIVLASIVLISALITFIIEKPVPFWTLALWVFLAAVWLSVNFSTHSEPDLPQNLFLFKIFEVCGAASFLVYLIFISINTFMS